MELVNFLAQFWGFSLVILALSFLINQKHIHKVMGLIENEGAMVVSGIFGVFFGVFLVLTYNVWDSSWHVLISILSWAILIKGCIRLFFPDFVIGMLAKYKHKTEWISLILVFLVLFGCFLIYMGFSA